MNQRKIILYIACSVDGYIAGPNDNLDFLSMVERPSEDYGYQKFTDTIDAVIMGRKTYDKVLSFGIPFPHSGRNCFVVT
ncbi:MAG TPA: dihydrofolate reductase, partial [Bacteroidia bacterium]|nr:dihydrofolate reductase [Bacteroidia bacterium]